MLILKANNKEEEGKLILEVYVNDRKIEEIHIHNKGQTEYADGFYIYGVEKPEGVDRYFTHERSRGWKPLAVQVLKHLITLGEKF